jgi:aryl-alcohol dehydrogenase-like predicted oxidoreductase
MGLKKRTLGNTGIAVSELCFGVLPMGPLQYGLSPEEGGFLIREAVERGVSFLDTAQAYRTYPHIRHAFDMLPDDGQHVVVSTKAHAKTYREMEDAIEEARRELGRDVIDIFLIHAAREDSKVFVDRRGAIDCLVDMKARGRIRAAGVSTHSVDVVRVARDMAELDIIFPIINAAGLGVLNGTRDEMAQAIDDAAKAGKGLFAMKSLGGGNLLTDRKSALDYVRGLPGISSIAVGMVTRDELDMNIRLFNDEEVPSDLAERTRRQKRLIVQPFCVGCGACVNTCPNSAMTLVEGKAVNDKSKCILCGYCAPVCPQFAIRLV